MTILGDCAQTVDDVPRDVRVFLPKIFGRHLREIEMRRSYRNTLEIAEYASKWNREDGIQYLERHGAEVIEVSCLTEGEALQIICDHIEQEKQGYETIAILTMTEGQAKRTYQYLKEKGNKVHYIDRNSSAFCKGITITTYYLAKGLEFDKVFVLGGEPENPFYGQYQYISATRALHELEIYHIEA